MKERLEFLLRKNRAERDRSARIEEFSHNLGQLTDLSPGTLVYSSFEETMAILEKTRRIRRDAPSTTWNTAIHHEFDSCLTCMRHQLPGADCFLLLFDHYLFLGAIQITSGMFLQNTRGFFSLGEETMILVDKNMENYFKVAACEDQLTETGYFFLVNTYGDVWSRILAECLPVKSRPLAGD